MVATARIPMTSDATLGTARRKVVVYNPVNLGATLRWVAKPDGGDTGVSTKYPSRS